MGEIAAVVTLLRNDQKMLGDGPLTSFILYNTYRLVVDIKFKRCGNKWKWSIANSI